MRAWRYSRWDGSQSGFSLEPFRALDALSELLLHGLDVAEALEWMLRHGFDLAGLPMRVMGLDEIAAELRRELDAASRDLAQRFEAILDREERVLRGAHGIESARVNEFLARRHGEAADASDRSLTERIESFREHRFEDPEAEAAYQDLLARLERMKALERLARDLASGSLGALEPAGLGELLSEDALRSLIWLRGLEQRLSEAGYLRPGEGGPELTPRAIQRIGAQALAAVYATLRKGRPGGHEVAERGPATPRPDETRPFAFGDPLDLDPVRTLLAALRRRGGAAGLPIELEVDDFEVRERDFGTETTTVLLLDMSWSMSWAGRFPAAKRVALALDHLIRTRWPRDRFFVVGFSTRARALSVRELPLITWDMGDPFTNLQEGLLLADRLIARHPCRSPQILVITDGQPTAWSDEGQIHVEWPMGFGGTSPHAVARTLQTVRQVTRRGATINTFMLDDSPELVGFVERMTEINRGRALYTTPGQLGRFVMVDFVARRRGARRR
jgi:uncharacterized protein with von Willebrand factor type A (vWA) domain